MIDPDVRMFMKRARPQERRWRMSVDRIIEVLFWANTAIWTLVLIEVYR